MENKPGHARLVRRGEAGVFELRENLDGQVQEPRLPQVSTTHAGRLPTLQVHIRTEVVAFAPNHRPELLTALRNELRHTLHQFRFILLSLAEGHSIHGCSLVLGHGYKLASAIHLLMERLSSSWICFLSTRQKQAQSLNENTALSHRSKTASNIRSLD